MPPASPDMLPLLLVVLLLLLECSLRLQKKKKTISYSAIPPREGADGTSASLHRITCEIQALETYRPKTGDSLYLFWRNIISTGTAATRKVIKLPKLTRLVSKRESFKLCSRLC